MPLDDLDDLYIDWQHYNYEMNFYDYANSSHGDLQLWLQSKSTLEMMKLVDEADEELICDGHD